MDFGCDLLVFLAKFCHTRQLTENYDEHYSGYIKPHGTPVPPPPVPLVTM